MISVEEARERILAGLSPCPAEQVALPDGLGRVLAEDIASRRTQPPAAVSAMDGYAVRAADATRVPATLRLVGYVPAGGAHEGVVGPGEAVRIFTGATLPDGADAVVIQEDAEADGELVTVREAVACGRHVRPAGLDFREGEVLLKAGRTLSARDIGMAAGMNVPWLMVRRRPRVAILATGDEIVMPGEPVGANRIVSSNSLSLAAAVTVFGGDPLLLGIAGDNEKALRTMAAGARGADMLVTTGGASVGEHDLVHSVLKDEGLELDFWKIAMRPGKPLMFGRIGDAAMLGLPGNPVSTLVCATIFLGPAIARLSGSEDLGPRRFTASLGGGLGENDQREDYLRATLSTGPNGEPVATPFERQDSSMMSRLAAADCLVVRPPHAPPAAPGASVECIGLPTGRLRL